MRLNRIVVCFLLMSVFQSNAQISDSIASQFWQNAPIIFAPTFDIKKARKEAATTNKYAERLMLSIDILADGTNQIVYEKEYYYLK